MSIIEKVKQLREATGAGFKDCNIAIKESDGDLELVKEGNLSIKQDNLFDDIYIKETND